MKIVKVINNNVVSSVDDKECEFIILGRGIGFRKTAGMRLKRTGLKSFIVGNMRSDFMRLR